MPDTDRMWSTLNDVQRRKTSHYIPSPIFGSLIFIAILALSLWYYTDNKTKQTSWVIEHLQEVDPAKHSDLRFGNAESVHINIFDTEFEIDDILSICDVK